MKSNKIVVMVLLSINLLSCSHDKIVELPLTMQNGYGPFSMGLGGIAPNSENESNPWYKTYLKVAKFPEDLTDVKYGHIETNIYQSVYQDYLLGNITKEWYDGLQKSWNWTPDTLNLSKDPIKTKIAFAYGKNSEGVLQIVVDANNNLDLSDDILFSPLDMAFVDENENKDEIAQAQAVNASFEIFVHNKIVPVCVPLFVMYHSQINMFMCNFSQYATTQYKDEQIAVSSSNFTNLSYEKIEVTFMQNSLKHENGVSMKRLSLIILLVSILLCSHGGHALTADTAGSQVITRAGTQPSLKGASSTFTGNVRRAPLFQAKFPEAPFSGAYVTFEPGARTFWHVHPAGQHLIVVSGVGRTGEWGGKVEEIKAGDVLWCPPGVKHWHGASPTTAMTHIALSGRLPDKNTEWMEAVSDEQYSGGR